MDAEKCIVIYYIYENYNWMKNAMSFSLYDVFIKKSNEKYLRLLQAVKAESWAIRITDSKQ